VFLLLVLAGCDPNITDKDGSGDDTGVDDTGTDTDSGTDTDTPAEGDVEGPDLPECAPQAGGGDLVALSGVVLTPDGPVAGHVVYSRASGTIACAGDDCDTAGAEVVCTEGVISPGLIDAHNHLQYNSLPPWQVGPEFEDRYEWQSDDRYDDYKTAFNVVKDDYKCEIMKWAEARELIHGTTAAVGSSGDDACIDALVRNLDEGSTASGLDSYDLDYNSSNVTDRLDASDGAGITADLASGALDAALYHVAEGKDGSVRDEIDYMSEIGMVGPGQSYVHSADATTAQLAQMAADGTGLIWSPRSNLALYGTTTPVEIADALGVPWAIGTDWTPSGSMAPLGELQCAAEWLSAKGDPISDVTLWEKATTDAARAVGADGVLGQLMAGMKADISVFTWSRTPYRGVIDAQATDVRLVVVDGQALYGLTDLVTPLNDAPDRCEALDVCGEPRSICVADGTSGDDADTLADVEATLTSAMAGISMPAGYEYAAELYDLFLCAPADSCDLSAPTGGDADGDGIADGDDLCPDVYDPNQWDEDGDGMGDSCDECPLTVETECEGAASDMDSDGVPNEDDNCVRDANADQADRDGDGIGDVCDACPDEPSPDGACTTTIDAIRDLSHASHPEEGAVVTISDVVVTGVRTGAGFFVQDAGLAEYGGLYVYDFGDNTVSVGDVVTVTGTYEEYYGLTELTSPTVSVTGTAVVPDPIAVDACDVGTGGSRAEALEAMLLVVEDVTVTTTNPDDPSDYDEFEVDGCLRVDDFLWDDLDQPAGFPSYVSITGVLNYSFDNAKLAPRGAEDLVE
jgi:cytosine/adenosine deaminase-related metal-dependent hydrolase